MYKYIIPFLVWITIAFGFNIELFNSLNDIGELLYEYKNYLVEADIPVILIEYDYYQKYTRDIETTIQEQTKAIMKNCPKFAKMMNRTISETCKPTYASNKLRAEYCSLEYIQYYSEVLQSVAHLSTLTDNMMKHFVSKAITLNSNMAEISNDGSYFIKNSESISMLDVTILYRETTRRWRYSIVYENKQLSVVMTELDSGQIFDTQDLLQILPLFYEHMTESVFRCYVQQYRREYTPSLETRLKKEGPIFDEKVTKWMVESLYEKHVNKLLSVRNK